MDHWADLDVFHAVAETGSLAQAAKRLKLSHPTVGRRLDALEQRLGAPLVSRGASGVTLTALGEAILDNVRRMAEEADAVSRLAVGGDQAIAGAVTVTALSGVGELVVTRVLADFRRRHPDVEINLDITSRRANLAQREADVAVRLTRPGDQASLIARRVAQIGVGFYAAPSYLDARGRPSRLSELADHDAIVPVSPTSHMWPDDIDGEPSRPPRAAFTSDDPTALLTAAEAGLGICTHSHWRARGRPTLERVLPDIEPAPLDLWIVTHADLKRSARIRAVFDHIAESLAANARYFRHGDEHQPERFELVQEN